MSLSIIILLSLIVTNVNSATSFATGKYANELNYTNNSTITKKLVIPNANELEVTVIGKTEKCCDYITIYANKKYRFSGIIKQRFIVPGSSIRVNFKSDGRTTDEGFLVEIKTRLPADIFNDIKEQLITSTEKILKYGTNKIYLKLNNNLKTLKKLHSKIKNNKELTSTFNKVIDELIVIGQTYKEIAIMSSNIMHIHKQQFDIIDDLKQQTSHNIDKIQQKHQEYQTLLNNTQNELAILDDSLEKQKHTFSIDGYNTIMQTLTDQQQIWKKFYNDQDIIITKLVTHSHKIKLLLHVLEINSQIYQQSANVASLHKNSVLKLDNLINLPELQNIISNLDKSESDILQWLEKTKQTDL